MSAITTVRPRRPRVSDEPLAARRILNVLMSALARHRGEWATLAVLLSFAAAIHALGMATYPDWIDDPGTYLSQAWAVQYEHALSPYSYFYDHAPAGWVQIALWSMLTNGFGRHTTAIGFGNECMLIAKLISCALIYALGRRSGAGRVWPSVAVLLFAASPLALHYTRLTYLDNLATPWLLLAFLLATSPRGHLLAVAGSAFAFANAALTKETVLITLPALVLALWQNSHARTRSKAMVIAAAAGSWMILYPALAVIKGELLPGPDHNSLIGTALWQLSERQSSGSLLEAGSATRALMGDWLAHDPLLLIAGASSLLPALAIRRLRPWALVFMCHSTVLFTGGYVPFMHVITLLPWAALLVTGVLATGTHRWVGRTGSRHTIDLAMGAALLAAAAPTWARSDHRMMTRPDAPPLQQAEQWVARNVPRERTVVVHDALWTDLVHKFRFPQKNVIIVYKVDTDPAVMREMTRIDYLVLPDYYYLAPAAETQYPTVLAARDRGIAVARFGEGEKRAVTIYRVSAGWSPKS